MRKKLITLTLALAAVAGAGLSSAPSSDAATCNFRVCCPDTGTCYCCSRPCPVQCP